MGSTPTLDHHPPDDDTDPTTPTAAKAFDQLNPLVAAGHGVTAQDQGGLRKLEDGLARGWRVTLDDHNENTGPANWRRQHVYDRVARAQARAADQRRVARAEHAFDQLNPDYGIPADQHNRDGQQAMRDRETALALGTRVAVAAMRETDRDPVIWVAGQDYRAADAVRAARPATGRVKRGPERIGPER
jgi:hypothetical protein